MAVASIQRATLLMAMSRGWFALAEQKDRLIALEKQEANPPP
jgi:hypothetical protein